MKQRQSTSDNIKIPALDWRPRNYQQALWNYLEGGGKRSAICWHRRAGKDLFAINRIAYCACPPSGSHKTARTGLYWHILPTYNQGRKVIWEGSRGDGYKFIDAFPQSLISSMNHQEMRISFTSGSTYQVIGGDDPDRLVGANPIGIVFSEYSLMNPKCWEYLMPILAENGGWALFIATPRGENHFYTMLKEAQSNPEWFAQTLTVNDTFRDDDNSQPVISPQDVENCRKQGMLEATVQQEFYGSFKAPLVGSFYGDYIDKADADGRITSVPYESKLPVHTAWDLGLDDMTAIWFYQQSPGGEIRLIDFYENSGEGLLHYVKFLKSKDYNYGSHFLPWDIAVKELSSGKSRLDTIRQAGLRPVVVVKQYAVADGIETVRNILGQCWFDSKRCKAGIESLKSYRKQFNEQLQVFREQPVHDKFSHGADAMRTLAMGLRKHSSKLNMQTSSKGDYDTII